jgi:hypothetical protein
MRRSGPRCGEPGSVLGSTVDRAAEWTTMWRCFAGARRARLCEALGLTDGGWRARGQRGEAVGVLTGAWVIAKRRHDGEEATQQAVESFVTHKH